MLFEVSDTFSKDLLVPLHYDFTLHFLCRNMNVYLIFLSLLQNQYVWFVVVKNLLVMFPFLILYCLWQMWK